jgi:tRNA (guanine37-N1)-methyltransferase
MHFGLVTLFPEMFRSLEDFGVVGRAVKKNIISLDCWNPRDFTHDRHRTVDDRPYGGGPGMLMKVQPLQDAIQEAKASIQSQLEVKKPEGKVTVRTVYLSPQGQRLNHKKAEELAEYDGLICVCGRYEGVDERLIEAEIDEEISIGDFVLSGGELASMVLLDSISRLVPGVLGHSDSANEDSFANGLLDCPHYTRPEVFMSKPIPDVLKSGNHEEIRRWRLKQSLGRTWQRRPDLLDEIELDSEQQKLLQEFIREVNR